jgi:aspartyl/asparaginyl beta-hydroxylase (cupin superfamily)
VNTFLDMVIGRRRPYPQQPTHFHYPGLPVVEFFDRDLFPWLPELEAETDAISRELSGLLGEGEGGLVPYIQYPDGLPLDQWTELNHSPRWSAFHLHQFGTPVAENLERCPHTRRVLQRMPQPHVAHRSPAAMFSVLKPRTRIPPHTGVANTRLVVHLPLIVPPGCGFRVGGETRAWRRGEAWVFDDTIEHEAWNDSDQVRIILIFDIWRPELSEAERQAITAVMTASDSFIGDVGAPML